MDALDLTGEWRKGGCSTQVEVREFRLRSRQYKLFYFEHPHPLLAEILWGWALQGHSGAGHSGGRLWGWALQGDSGAGHSRTLWGLGTPCTLQGHSGLSTPGRLWGWAILAKVRHSGVGHSGDSGNTGVGHSRKTLNLGTPETL